MTRRALGGAIEEARVVQVVDMGRSELQVEEEDRMSYAVAQPGSLRNRVMTDRQGKIGLSAIVEEITPEVASEILDHEMFDRQRKVRRYHVIYLSRLMQAGDFQPSEIKFAVTPDGRRHLINGQHRLLAIVPCGMPQTVLITTVSAHSMAHVSALYSAEDRGLSRTLADTYGAHDLATAIGLPQHFLARATGAMPLLELGFSPRPTGYRMLDTKRIRMLTDWSDELRSWIEIVGPYGPGTSGAGRFNRAAVIAVGLVTLRFQKDGASHFWKTAVENDGLKKGEPVRALVDYLADRTSSAGNLNYLYSKCVARCWNAYYEGRELRIVKAGGASDPILILGTPYDGKRVVQDLDSAA